MTVSYQMQLDIEISDPAELAAAATAHAIKSGMSEADWLELRSSNMDEVAADLHMLLDPGESPPGTKILHGEAVFLCGDEGSG